MKKLLVLLIMISFLSPLANAIIEKPNWKTGIYWKYRMTSGDSTSNMTLKIEGKEEIKINNESIQAWKIVEYIDGKESRTLYFKVEDHSIIKEAKEIKDRKLEIVYSPSFPIIKYNVDVGDTWGGLYKRMVRNVPIDTINMQSTCIGKEEIEVPAGKFECYKIKQEKTHMMGKREWNETLIFYYSAKAGNWVKMESYKAGEITKIELIETNYGKKKIPFPVYVVFIAMAIVVVIRKLGRRYN